jgi:hypothetical protein
MPRPAGTCGRVVWARRVQVRALDRSQLVLPMMPGMSDRRTHDYVRNSITNLFAAFNIARSGRPFSGPMPDDRRNPSGCLDGLRAAWLSSFLDGCRHCDVGACLERSRPNVIRGFEREGCSALPSATWRSNRDNAVAT